jgi:hypothetical protein
MSVDKVRGSTYISVGLKKLVGPPPEIYIFSPLLICTGNYFLSSNRFALFSVVTLFASF